MLSGAISLMGRSVILEFKGAYFQPTHGDFKAIYHKGGGFFGPELTVQLCKERRWYAFAAFDYFQKKGRSVGLCSPTKVELIPIDVGLKYFAPVRCDCVDLYVGLGLEAVNVRTRDCSPYVLQSLSKWGVGGIAKVGVYWYLPHNFVIDLFVDYSFVKTMKNRCCFSPRCGVQLVRANVSGVIAGIGLGYRF